MASLLSFIGAWVPDLGPQHRLSPEMIPELVPRPLRLLYEFTGNYPVPSIEQWRPPDWTPGLFGPQDQLLPPDQLEIAGERFTFLHENQGVWRCDTLAGHDDPPVFSDYHMIEDADTDEVCHTLSHFLVTFCLQELTFGAEHLYSVSEAGVEPRECVAAPVEPLWLDGHYAYGASTHSFYTAGGELLIMVAHDNMWLASNTGDGRSHLSTNTKVECLR